MALRAVRVFAFAYFAGEIAGVDVTESGVAADFGSLQQVFCVCVSRYVVLHFVIAVEGGYVPGDIGLDGCQEFG